MAPYMLSRARARAALASGLAGAPVARAITGSSQPPGSADVAVGAAVRARERWHQTSWGGKAPPPRPRNSTARAEAARAAGDLPAAAFAYAAALTLLPEKGDEAERYMLRLARAACLHGAGDYDAEAEEINALDALLARADEACYAAKEAGRDRVVAWSQTLAAPRT